MSAAQHGAEGQHRCVWCHSTYESMVVEKKRSSRAAAKARGTTKEYEICKRALVAGRRLVIENSRD